MSLSFFLLSLSVASQTWAFATIWRARSARRSDVRTIASPTSIRVSSMALRWSMCTMRKSQSRIQRLRWVFHAYQHTKSILIRDLHTCICRLEPFPSCDCCQHQDQEEIKKNTLSPSPYRSDLSVPASIRMSATRELIKFVSSRHPLLNYTTHTDTGWQGK